MGTFTSAACKLLRVGLCCPALLLAACLGPSGCCSTPPATPDRSAQDDTATYCRKYRKPDAEIHMLGVSNKAQDIERDFGAR